MDDTDYDNLDRHFAALQLITPLAQRRQSALQDPQAHPVSPIQLEVSGSTVEEEAAAATPPPPGQQEQQARQQHKQPGNISSEDSLSLPRDAATAAPRPAAASAAVTVTPLLAPDVVRLNIFVDDSRSEQVEQELAGMRTAVSLLQAQLAEVQAAAAGDARAKETGALRAQVARLEGAVQAGESRIRAQAADSEALRLANARLERQLAELQAAAGVAAEKENLLAEKENLAARLAAAHAEAAAKAARLDRMQAVAARDAGERAVLREFAAQEYRILTAQEQQLAAALQTAELQARSARADAVAAAQRAEQAEAALAEVRAALVAAHEEARAAQEAVAAAEQQAAEWQAQASEMDRNRQTAAANLRKAEREVDMVAKENEAMFRQISYVRSRLEVQQGLELLCPDLGKLARELSAWCEREQAARARLRA